MYDKQTIVFQKIMALRMHEQSETPILFISYSSLVFI